MELSNIGLDLIKEFEGFSATAYPDVIKVPTIGYGTTVYRSGVKVKLGDRIDQNTAMEELRDHVSKKCLPVIKSLVNVPLTQNQIDALCSFIYNVGSGNFTTSTLLKKLNSGDYLGAADQLPYWNKAGGKVFPGLVKRRTAERTLFLS